MLNSAKEPSPVFDDDESQPPRSSETNARSADNEVLNAGKLPGALLSAFLGGLTLHDPGIVVGPGIGRDAAAVRVGDAILVLKTDPITFASTGAARYLVSVNANDLACLGATPRWMLVTGMFPVGTTQGEIRSAFLSSPARRTRPEFRSLAATPRSLRPSTGRFWSACWPEKPTIARAPHTRSGNAGDLLVLSRPVALEGTALLAEELGELLA